MFKRRGVYALMLVLMVVAVGMIVCMRYPVRYYEVIARQAQGLEPAFICAVIHAESKFRPNAVSSKGAAGLMQLTSSTAQWIAEEMGMTDYDGDSIHEPEVNIAIGSYFLRWLLDYYGGDYTLALCAYNAGIGTVNRWLADERYAESGTLVHIPYPETREFVRRVNQNKRIYDIMLKYRVVDGGRAS